MSRAVMLLSSAAAAKIRARHVQRVMSLRSGIWRVQLATARMRANPVGDETTRWAEHRSHLDCRRGLQRRPLPGLRVLICEKAWSRRTARGSRCDIAAQELVNRALMQRGCGPPSRPRYSQSNSRWPSLVGWPTSCTEF